MKAALLTVLFLLSTTILVKAQDDDARVAPGCGPDTVKFEVKTARHSAAAAKPDPGKALVYFIQDNSSFASVPRPTTRAAVDGEWMGAASGNSFFFFSVEPGEHHACASWQTWVGPGVGVAQKTAALHFTAEPGGVYYLRAKNIFIRDRGRPFMKFELIDSDEGQLLAGNSQFSTSQQKK